MQRIDTSGVIVDRTGRVCVRGEVLRAHSGDKPNDAHINLLVALYWSTVNRERGLPPGSLPKRDRICPQESIAA